MKLSQPIQLSPQLPPTQSLAELTASLQSAASSRGFSVARSELLRSVDAFVTMSHDMTEMLRNARMMSEFSDPVLILGESGTGKELVARILHGNRDTLATMNNGHIRRECFYGINCSALSESLFESLLFGHIKGAFTGSVRDEPGLLRAAKDGTCFLDEIGDLPMTQQTKLLRVLETKRVRPVGSDSEYTINCRIVTATNKNLKDLISKGLFREDLYYRIACVVLRTSPLRDRPDDIEPITRRLCQRMEIDMPDELPPLEAYARGNVRALANYLLRVGKLGMTKEEALMDL